jgi:hypothetical protein
MTQVIAKRYGSALLVYFAGRVDQVHFKLFAMIRAAGGTRPTSVRSRRLRPSSSRRHGGR